MIVSTLKGFSFSEEDFNQIFGNDFGLSNYENVISERRGNSLLIGVMEVPLVGGCCQPRPETSEDIDFRERYESGFRKLLNDYPILKTKTVNVYIL